MWNASAICALGVFQKNKKCQSLYCFLLSYYGFIWVHYSLQAQFQTSSSFLNLLPNFSSKRVLNICLVLFNSCLSDSLTTMDLSLGPHAYTQTYIHSKQFTGISPGVDHGIVIMVGRNHTSKIWKYYTKGTTPKLVKNHSSIICASKSESKLQPLFPCLFCVFYLKQEQAAFCKYDIQISWQQ